MIHRLNQLKPTTVLGALVAVVLLSGCAWRPMVAPQVASDCLRSPEATAVAVDSVPLERLTGRFRLIVIDTINRRIPPFADTITLGPPDSAYMAALGAQTTRWGFVTKPTGPARTNSRMGPGEWRTDGKTMLTGSCAPLHCMDEASTLFVFRYVSDESIRGEWFHSLTGIGVLLDPESGRQIRSQAGVFCMRRI